MAAETFPKSLIKRRGGVFFNSHNLSTVDPMSKMLGFSVEKFLSNNVFQSKISLRP